MKKFIIKALFFGLPIVIIISISDLASSTYLNQNRFYKIPENDSILILGNSHSECALNDSLISASFNLSQSAESYFYTYFKLKKILSSNKNIKILVLEYSDYMFTTWMDKWTYGDEILTYKLPKYMHIIPWEDKLYLFKNNSGAFLLACRQTITDRLNFIFSYNENVLSSFRWGGFVAKLGSNIKQHMTLLHKNIYLTDTVSENKYKNISYLHKIIELCKENSVKLILLRSPIYPERSNYIVDHEGDLLKLYKNEFSSILFWDFSKYILEEDEFYDLEHLNYKGAKKFSLLINAKIKN